MESESLFSVIEFLSVQQMNTPQNKQQQKILYQLKKPVKTRNKFWTINRITEFHCEIYLKLFPLKNAMSNRNLMMRTTQCYLHLIMPIVKEDRKSSRLNTNNNQRFTLLTTNMKTIWTYSEATKFGKRICVIGDSHLNRIKKNIFQKPVNGGKHTLRFFEALHLRDWIIIGILPIFHEDQPDAVLPYIGSNEINNQTKNKINNEKQTGDIINTGKSCIDLGVKEVVISILPKNNIALTRLIRQVNDSLREHYVWNGFGFI